MVKSEDFTIPCNFLSLLMPLSTGGAATSLRQSVGYSLSVLYARHQFSKNIDCIDEGIHIRHDTHSRCAAAGSMKIILNEKFTLLRILSLIAITIDAMFAADTSPPSSLPVTHQGERGVPQATACVHYISTAEYRANSVPVL